MSRLLSFTWLMRRYVLHHPRKLTLYTTGFPARSLHGATCISSKTVWKPTYVPVNYSTMSGKSTEYSKSVQSNSVNKRENQKISSAKQQTVEELLNNYISSRDTENSLDPIVVLNNIARSTEKSAKQSLVLLNELTSQKHYVTLLNDINKSIEFSNDLKENIIIVLKAIGKISKRQKLFINKCEVDIYPDKRSQNNDMLLPEDGKILFDNIQNVILKNGLTGLQRKHLVTILSSFVETKQGRVKLFNELKYAILRQEVKEYTSEEISQIVQCFAKLKSSIDSCELFKSMVDEILCRGFVTFMSSEIPPILLGIADADQESHGTWPCFTTLTELCNKEIPPNRLVHSSIGRW